MVEGDNWLGRLGNDWRRTGQEPLEYKGDYRSGTGKSAISLSCQRKRLYADLQALPGNRNYEVTPIEASC